MSDRSTYKVVVVGELNVDLIFDGLDGKLPRLGTEIIAGEMTLTLGSSSAIFASNLSVLSPGVAFIGMVGKDSYAGLVMQSLEEKGVETSLIRQSTAYNTGITVACSHGNERAMVTYPGAMDHLLERDIADHELAQGQHMHLSSVFLQKGLKPDLHRLFSRAKALGLTTSLDPQWDPDEQWDIGLHELLPYVDIFLPNMEELKHLTGTSKLEDALESISGTANIVVVKDGARGAHLWTPETQLYQPAFLNPSVADTIGAGDSFNAGFISGYVQGISLENCLKRGALSGAVNTTRPGGTTAFTSLEEVVKLARERFNADFP